jgi:hypothetical protein
MFDEILDTVKKELSAHPAVAALPADQQNALHEEVATHVNNAVNAAPSMNATSSESTGLLGGLLSQAGSALAGGGMLTNALEGGVLSSITSRLGLPPAVTGALAAALPGIIQRFAQKKQAGM